MSAATIPAALTGACPAVRAAGPRDAVAGVPASWVAAPADVAEASALLAAASEHGLAVVARGGGTKLSWGAPPRQCDLVIDTLRLDAIVEHAAGDLVARVQAGVTMAALADALRTAGQQLALDVPPSGSGNGSGARGAASPTIGGTLATGMAGPRRLRYGTPRDLLIGITVVRPDGTVTSSGGKVVKNVAGYDLGKLYTGSYGTLGLITEAVFRLHPLPAAAAYITAGFASTAGAVQAVAAAAGSDLAPVAIEIDRPDVAGPIAVCVALEGDPDGVAERATLIRSVLGEGDAPAAGAGIAADPPPWWSGPGTWGGRGMRSGPGTWGAPRGGAQLTVIRVSFWAAAAASVLDAIGAAAAGAGVSAAVTGSAACGVLYVALSVDASPAAAARLVTGLRGALSQSATASGGPPAQASAVVLSAPADVRDAVDVWGPVPSLGLMKSLKDQFDPGHVMAPGRFAGGI